MLHRQHHIAIICSDWEQAREFYVNKLGFELIRNINAAHDEIYALLSDMSGLTIEMLDNMPFGTGPMMIWDIVNNAKNADFFKAVFKSE